MQTMTLKALAAAVQSGAIPGETPIIPWTTADSVVGWLYREPTDAVWSNGTGEYADAGQYEVLPTETARSVDAWRDGGPSPFADRYPGEPEKAEWLCASVWPASHILWKAEQDHLSGGA